MLHERIDKLCLHNTKYIVYKAEKNDYYKIGDVVVLDYDDFTDCPSYKNVVTGNNNYMYCDDLKLYVPKNIVGGKLI